MLSYPRGVHYVTYVNNKDSEVTLAMELVATIDCEKTWKWFKTIKMENRDDSRKRSLIGWLDSQLTYLVWLTLISVTF